MMHNTQKELLSLLRKVDLNAGNPRLIGKLIGVAHPQTVAHHLAQLEKKGLIAIDAKTRAITVQESSADPAEGLVKLPIFGTANCGPATLFAEQNLEGYLAVPRRLAGKTFIDDLFAVEAWGDSMNTAGDIKGGPIDSGDFVIFDKNISGLADGMYVLSVIEATANIKRFYRDQRRHWVRLESESTPPAKPIFVREDDFQEYLVNGIAVAVVKKSNQEKKS